ncbi:MAG: 4-(cytidine 5'-diphospho)-2-C-methyl-D-erythritol kinase [Bacteroidales bacterium]|nr:4-(cytidine 5'-diphospho)-2-C-methyl-D-erythritol kinase [Bacteroidales bacterium]
MTVYPNVKLNLGLRVLRKRPDGFHDLETLFVPYYGFRDELQIEPAPELKDIEIFIENCAWDPREDLTVKAWRLLKSDFPSLPAVRINLVKHSPVGAGLGGGSADAAFALRSMNSIFSLGLSDADMAGYASRLGSDCAFFIYNRPMLGTGRGEILEPMGIDLSCHEIRIAVPEGVHVSTREAYAGITPYEEGPSVREIVSRPVSEWRGALKNDFEDTVFASHPEIAELKENFYASGAVYAAMSGSGSAVFGIFQ